MRLSSVLAVLVLVCCAPALAGPVVIGSRPGHVRHHPYVDDLGPASGFQENWDNHHRRGRSLVAEDFDGDGHVDYFVGNVGEESVVVRNLGPDQDGVPHFEPAQTLLDGDIAFVASSADYDNDGDMDLFVGCGGLEGMCLDFLFRNDSTPGRIVFTDVSATAGISGPSFQGRPLAHATGGATWGDYDRDGDPDLFISINKVPGQTIHYKTVLWTNRGDGTFSNTTFAANLAYWGYSSPGAFVVDWAYFQNSTWIDFDNDGDLDLFLNNARGPNVLWRNFLVERGAPWFEDVTAQASLPGDDLRFPWNSFASAVADFNNDGFQDLMLFAYGPETEGPYGNSHGLFLNRQGQGFYNVAAAAGINLEGGEWAMGSQVADLNADGVPDLVLGGGDPESGGRSRLLLSCGAARDIPLFEDSSHLIDFEPPHGIDPGAPPFPEIPTYPYRTHGMAAADFDEDGQLELGVVNGGRAMDPPIVREPDRLFDFHGSGAGGTLRVRLRGNGVSDGRDAIGARAYVEIGPSPGGRRVFQTVLAGSGFSAQNERTLTFGLGPDRAERLVILWPSGCVQVVESPVPPPAGPLVVQQECGRCAPAPRPVEAWLGPPGHEACEATRTQARTRR